MPNRDIAELLHRIADIFDYQNVQWKPQAYRKAARQIESLSQDLSDIYKEKGEKGLEEIPGIGRAIAGHIVEFIKTGRVKHFEDVIKSAPKGIHEMRSIMGLGPKKIRQLVEKINVKSVAGLKAAAKKHKLHGITGFGEKTEQNLLQSIAQYEHGQERMQIDAAMAAADAILAYLRQHAAPDKLDYAGSLRRMKETIGDIDILAAAKDSKRVIKAFTLMPDVKRVLSEGPTRASVVLDQGCNVDLRVVDPKSYAAALLYFTGSKDHNIELRQLAIKKGYKLSEYGLFGKKTGKQAGTGKQVSKQARRIDGTSEEAIYQKLDLQYIPPEMRERQGEIQLAQQKKIPSLVELKDIKGDLQMHTVYSDGNSSITDMARKAKSLGYEYIALTDHSQSQRAGNGMSISDIKKQWKEIDAVARKEKFTILKGSEVDILSDGSLDYPESILRQLDIVLGSIHSGFKMPEQAMTKRICTALDNKYLHILAHPTARRIGKRAPHNANMAKVFAAAVENGKILEINGQPERLDLKEDLIRLAKQHKARFVISTDAHSPEGLDFMKFGIGMARRGWVEKEEVINTLPLGQLKKMLHR